MQVLSGESRVFGPCHHTRGSISNRRKGACNHSSCRAEEQEGIEVIFGVNDLQCQIPYHPATNGIAENMVKNVKQWLKKQGGSTTAYRAISDFLRTYRNVPHMSTGRTPAEVIFKHLPRTHLSMIVPDMTERLKNQLQTKEELKQPRSFAEDDMVFIRDHRPTSTHKWIEGRVSSKTGVVNGGLFLVHSALAVRIQYKSW